EELSVFALSDGSRAAALPAARDYSRVGDGDMGPNTGGMGSFSPVPKYGHDEIEALVERIHRPVIRELALRRTPFIGVLYSGLMLTRAGRRVLESNCRFGDPETQAVVPRLEGDLLALLAAAAGGDLRGAAIPQASGAAVTAVLAAAEYPARGDSGTPIRGV